jgi:hypothetical protein
MLKYRIYSLPVIVALLFTAVLTQSGCHENTIINSKIAPSNNSDSVYSYTMPLIITHTYLSDSTVTSTNIGGIPIYEGVGAISDPYFGTMVGSTYFQIIPNVFNNVFAPLDSVTVDSAILLMPFSGLVYGDTSDRLLTQSYQVFYMTDSIGYSSTYFSYSTKAIDVANPLSDPTPVNLYSIKDTTSVNGIYYNKGMRIKLKLPSFMSRLTNAINQAVTSSTPPTAFINAFNGICVRPANTNMFAKAFPYFQLDGADRYSEANIAVYYHHTNFATPDTLIQIYYFNSSICAHFNNITKTYSHSPVNALYHSTAANDNIIALQNQPGPNVDIIIPGIKLIPKGVAINKVQLQLALLPGRYNPAMLFAPEKLSPLGVGINNYPIGVGVGLEYNIADRYPLTSLSPLGVMGGYIDSVTRNGTKVYIYTLDFPREIMASIQSNNDTIHLHISGTQDFYGAFHMVAGGGNYADTNYRAKINVVYSKLKTPLP